jgi:hypothetical protein
LYTSHILSDKGPPDVLQLRLSTVAPAQKKRLCIYLNMTTGYFTGIAQAGNAAFWFQSKKGEEIKR